jgi:hypothetical protein
MKTQQTIKHTESLAEGAYKTIDEARKAYNVEAEIDAIFDNFKNTREAIQAVLIYTMMHVEKFGDIRYFIHLVRKMESEDGKGFKADAVVEWINEFTKCDIEYDKELKKHTVVYNGEKSNNCDNGKAKNWWEFKAKKDFTSFKISTVLHAAIALNSKKAAEKKRYADKNEMGKADQIEVDSDLTHALKLLMGNPALVKMVMQESAKLQKVEEPKADAA